MVSRVFFLIGIIFLVLSGLVFLGGKFGIYLFKLPGDIVIKKENFTFFFPITTSILISLFLTVLFRFFK